jgi:hypothetical protein
LKNRFCALSLLSDDPETGSAILSFGVEDFDYSLTI